jgi:hypothetical protein
MLWAKSFALLSVLRNLPSALQSHIIDHSLESLSTLHKPGESTILRGSSIQYSTIFRSFSNLEQFFPAKERDLPDWRESGYT